MDISNIDINQIQAVIANVEQLVDQLDQLIPGQTGVQIRNAVQFVELIVNNPAVLQLVLFVLSQLPAGASAQDVKNVAHSFDVTTTVA